MAIYKHRKIIDAIHADPKACKRLSANPHPAAVNHLLGNLQQHPNKIDWWHFSGYNTPYAVKYLLQHPDKINWERFPRNTNPQAVDYMLQHPDKIVW